MKIGDKVYYRRDNEYRGTVVYIEIKNGNYFYLLEKEHGDPEYYFTSHSVTETWFMLRIKEEHIGNIFEAIKPLRCYQWINNSNNHYYVKNRNTMETE